VREVGLSPTQLPPTVGIKDPATAAWMQAMANAWDQRSGVADPLGLDRFITAREFGGLAVSAMAQALGSSPTGPLGGGGDPASAAQVNSLIDHLSQLVMNSVLFQKLGQEIASVDIEAVRARIELVLSDITGTIEALDEGITERVEVLESTTASQTTQINAAVSRLDDAEAAIVAEESTRATKDYALAEAINTMWASIGGASAVISDGTLAAATPNSAAATKWLQVVASVTDPNTGLVNSTSIKQDLNSYASNVNGRMSSTYTVRAQVSVGGQTVVGGFGLVASSGSGDIGGPDSEGPTIDFGVRADKFFIAATSATPDGGTQLSQGTSIPFMVLTTGQYLTVNGSLVYYPPGVYMKHAAIGTAAIGTAQIADLAATTAKIGDASITNAKINDTIQSNTFSPGSSGWRIQKSGIAEFDMVRTRRREVLATGYFDPASVQGGFLTMQRIVPAEKSFYWETVPFVHVVLPAFSTGISDADFKSTSANQPYGVAVFNASGHPSNAGGLRSWSSSVTLESGGHTFRFGFSGAIATTSVYSNVSYFPDDNTISIQISVSAVALERGGQFYLPVLQWVLFKL
jgi:hypothetical protein